MVYAIAGFVLFSLMTFAQKESLHNKTLPVRYSCCEVIERLTYNWLITVSDSSVAWTSQRPSVTLGREVLRSNSQLQRLRKRAVRFGPVESDSSFSTNNQYIYCVKKINFIEKI